MTAYYNEFEPLAAATIREAISRGLIAPGIVDERDIRDVRPDELAGFDQVHLFAGGGLWSYALRLAGWPDEGPVWTCSCPCQPFSTAGKGLGFADERHLWPAALELIKACRPPIIFGEQVASSTAIGKQPDDAMLGLWNRQALLRLLQNGLEEGASDNLQTMPQCGCSGMERSASIFDGLPCEQTCCGSEDALSGEGDPVRSDGGLGAAEAGPRRVRGDGAPVQPCHCQGVGHAFSRQDQPQARVCENEHSSRTVCVQHGVRRLGRGVLFEDGAGNTQGTSAAVASTLRRTCREIEAQDGSSWLNTVQLDLENEGYTFGASVTVSCGFGAPNIRARTYWVAHAHREGLEGWVGLSERAHQRAARADGLADWLAHPMRAGRPERRAGAGDGQASGHGEHGDRDPGPVNGFWRDADWLLCRDPGGPRWRPVDARTFPLAPGHPARVGGLRISGNAINPQVAAAFIEAVMDHLDGLPLAEAA